MIVFMVKVKESRQSGIFSRDFIVIRSFQNHGDSAAALSVAEQYVEAFGKLAKETNTLILPANIQV